MCNENMFYQQNKDIIIHTEPTGALDQIQKDEGNYWREREINWAIWVNSSPIIFVSLFVR
jgi:hypothetical protein